LGLLLAAVGVAIRLEDSGTVHVDFMGAAAVLDLVDIRAAHQLVQEVRESLGRVITALQ
tara:strand:- start:48643 stop:48819 length:177 start_codon:yes stop_codon:yes gene_type:complete